MRTTDNAIQSALMALAAVILITIVLACSGCSAPKYQTHRKPFAKTMNHRTKNTARINHTAPTNNFWTGKKNVHFCESSL